MKTASIPRTDTASLSRVYTELEGMTAKHTKIINGFAVTKWSESAFEVGTFGKTSESIHAATDRLVADLAKQIA